MTFVETLARRSVLVALLASALSATTGQAQTAAEPIRIGMIEGLSGPFANTGEAVYRNLVWATERVNARGGVKLPASQGGTPAGNRAL